MDWGALLLENRRLRRQLDRTAQRLNAPRGEQNPEGPAGEPTAHDPGDDLAVDARELDRESLGALLDVMGIDRDRSVPVGDPTTDPVDPRVRRRAEARAALELRRRAEAIAPGAIEGKSAEPAAVAARLRELGVHDPALFLPPSKPQPDAKPTPEAARQSALEQARKRLLHKLAIADASRVALDTRTLDPLEFEALTTLRGYDRLAPGVVGASGPRPA